MPSEIRVPSFAAGFDVYLRFHGRFNWISRITADTAMINPNIDGGIVADPAEHIARAHSKERSSHMAARARLFSWVWARVLLRTSLICCVSCVRAAI